MTGAVEPRPTLREAAATFQASVDLLHRPQSFPSSAASRAALAAMGAEASRHSAPPADELEQLRARVLAHARDGRSYNELPLRDLRRAAWLLWTDAEPIENADRLLDAAFQEAERSGAAKRRLIEAWIKNFRPDRGGTERGGQAIRRLLATGQHDRRLDLWRRADDRFQFFSPRQGPAALAKAVLDDRDPVEDVLAAIGLTDPMRAVSGYARAVHVEVTTRVGPLLCGPRGSSVFTRACDYYAPGGKFRFSSGKDSRSGEPAMLAAMAHSFLDPWMQAGTRPGEEIRSAVQAFLLIHLGDPRLPNNGWGQVNSSAQGVMRRWLGRATFRAFFELIGQHSNDRQWRYREAFWSAYLERDLVQDVWLALGAGIRASAKLESELKGSYGSLLGSDSGQALLLFRIGEFVFCEWSNMGKLRAWPASNRQAPKLYERRYTAGDVRTPSLEFATPAYQAVASARLSYDGGLSHTVPENGRWQSRAARFIAERTGISLTEREWMPSRRVS